MLKDMVYLIGWTGDNRFTENEKMIIYEYQLRSGEFGKMEVNKDDNHIKIFIVDDQRNVVKEVDDIVAGVVNLSNKGDRWEGSHWKDTPFGYGCVFDEDNHMVYEGYMADGKKVCYGNEYYKNGVIRYRGSYMNDCKHGHGCLYDMRGELIYEGEWALDQNDNFNVTIPNGCRDDGMIHNLVHELIIGDYCYNELRELIIRDYPNLTVFYVGVVSFTSIEKLEIAKCDKLERISVGGCWDGPDLNETCRATFENVEYLIISSKIESDL